MAATRGRNRFQSFYRSFLRCLFEKGLDTPADARGAEWDATAFGRIPYLNGGMFAKHPLEAAYPDIDIPDEVFGRLFGFFDEWRWHLDTRISASGRDINPDVLGYIFEQYINDRAQMGAYYTKEDITEYIGRSTIVPWLLGEVAGKAAGGMKGMMAKVRNSGDRYIFPAMLKGVDIPLPDDIGCGVPAEPQATLRKRRAAWNRPADPAFALPTEIWRETVARRQRVSELRHAIRKGEVRSPDDFVTLNLDIRAFAEDLVRETDDHRFVGHFYDALRRVSILDPTCGSGAFLFAALDILESLYDACLDRMEEFHDANTRLFKAELEELAGARNRLYFVDKSIILRNLYGVDLMHEATEIARLRLFLKMVAAVDPDPRDPNLGLDPLPDIDFNIRTGNTLVGYANPADVKAAILPPDQLALDTELYDRVEAKAQDVADIFERFKALQQTSTVDAGFAQAKTELNKKLAELNQTLDRAMAERDLGIDPGTLRGNQRLSEWKAKTQPFHWFSDFYAITVANKGFDVIIGNPPYVSSRTIGYSCSFLNRDEKKMPDIYSWCMLRSFDLCSENGRFGMIVPLSLTFSGDYQPLRARLRQLTAWVASFDNIPAALFETVSQRCSIVIARKGHPFLHATRLYRWRSVFREHLTSILEYIPAASHTDGQSAILKTPSAAVRDVAEHFAAIPFVPAKLTSEHVLFSTTARNYISAFLAPPPCLDAVTMAPEPSGDIPELAFEDEEEKFAAYSAFSGDLAFLLWLVCGDGFHVTKGNLVPLAGAIRKIAPDARQALAKLGALLDIRHFEGLSFKKNAGKYVGSFNSMPLKDITRRADILLLTAMGFPKPTVFEVIDWYVRILSINDSLGEKAIPSEVSAAFPPSRYDKRSQQALFRRIDTLLFDNYGFTPSELDYLVHYDIKHRTASRPEEREGT